MYCRLLHGSVTSVRGLSACFLATPIVVRKHEPYEGVEFLDRDRRQKKQLSNLRAVSRCCHQSQLQILGSSLLCQQERSRLRPEGEREESVGPFLHDGDADLAAPENQTAQLTWRACVSKPNALDLAHLRNEKVHNNRRSSRADEATWKLSTNVDFCAAGQKTTRLVDSAWVRVRVKLGPCYSRLLC